MSVPSYNSVRCTKPAGVGCNQVEPMMMLQLNYGCTETKRKGPFYFGILLFKE